MRRVTHERYISQSQWVNCDLARRYVGLNLSQHYAPIGVGQIIIITILITLRVMVIKKKNSLWTGAKAPTG